MLPTYVPVILPFPGRTVGRTSGRATIVTGTIVARDGKTGELLDKTDKVGFAVSNGVEICDAGGVAKTAPR